MTERVATQIDLYAAVEAARQMDLFKPRPFPLSEKRETREVREHRVMGRTVTVLAETEEHARLLARAHGEWAWEAERVAAGTWRVFVARHEDAFALND